MSERTTPKPLTLVLEDTLGWHEALRRMHFEPDELFFSLEHKPAEGTGVYRVGLTVQTGGRQAAFLAGTVAGETQARVCAAWDQLILRWNDAAGADDDAWRDGLWARWHGGDLMQKGLYITGVLVSVGIWTVADEKKGN